MDPNMMMEEEAGGSDNRLSLNPSDFDGVCQDWEDGKEYTLTVRVRQMAPGEFTVLDAKASGAAAAAEEPGEESEVYEPEGEPGSNNAETKGRGAYPNPAVERLITTGSRR